MVSVIPEMRAATTHLRTEILNLYGLWIVHGDGLDSSEDDILGCTCRQLGGRVSRTRASMLTNLDAQALETHYEDIRRGHTLHR